MERVKISSSGGCDLISTMPDPILHHILGLLKTREAVQTCVLSKRWQYLWISLPSLDFDFREFTALEEPPCDSEEEETSVPRAPSDTESERARDSVRFAIFVEMVLFSCEPLHLDVFRLSFGALNSADVLLKDWVIYAVQHNPRVVHLAFLQLPPSLVHSIYTCTSLEELYLHHSERALSQYTCRAAVNLPNLKRLSIHNVFLAKNELQDLLAGCPVLQYLWLERCQLQEDENSHQNNINALKSKWLINSWLDRVEKSRPLTALESTLRTIIREHVNKLVQMQEKIGHDSLQHLNIVNGNIPFIRAPNLLTFCYISSEPIVTLSMPSLTDALLELKNPLIGGWLGLTSFLSGLVNVRTLELQVPWAELQEEDARHVLPELPIFQQDVLPELPIFQKMHELSVGAFCMCFDFCLVSWILGKVPNLKKLTLLQQRECSCFGHDEEVANTSAWTDASLRTAVSHCNNLEVVEVKYSRFDQMVRELVDALVDGTKELQNANILLSKH
ncbi:hypothetical protein LUZ61_016459 [Rhynchospora tenuis]|uniref:F-box domain-containing protein n=1 Tax=Rhynchospora tenuis TaxID=198213 RepID=A0AAD5Z5I8_9POAL|nr:hypothetical protein LUZ61_016459 [Rhynchospora tenuis]